MRYLLAIWFAPLAFFWGWYALSANDWNFGTIYLSRELHDVVFKVYGDTLSVDPGRIPGMIAGATIVDSALVLSIAAFRWRASWWPGTKEQTIGMVQQIRVLWQRKTAARKEIEAETLTNLQAGPVHPAE